MQQALRRLQKNPMYPRSHHPRTMTHPQTPLAEWTVPEKCNYLAKEIMGWPGGYKQDQYGFWGALKTPKTYHQWEPYRSWDNGREVEEKVMEEWELSLRFISKFSFAGYIEADLPTRMDAVISAHLPLKP